MEDVEDESETCDNLRPSIGSEHDFDDELGVPELIKIVDIGDGPVAIVQSEEDVEGSSFSIKYHDLLKTCIFIDDLLVGQTFNMIHNYIKFKSFHRNVFIPGSDVTVSIINYERNATTHMLNPNLCVFIYNIIAANLLHPSLSFRYTISVTHGNYTWEIKKRYKQFQHLHQQLILFRTSLNIPFPTKTHRNRIKSFKENVPQNKKGKRKGALPRFPKKPEILVGYERLAERMTQIEEYLNNLLSINIYRNHPSTVISDLIKYFLHSINFVLFSQIEFLEVSHLTFIKGLGTKGKEGMVKKKTGSTQPGQSGCICFGLYRCLFCVR